MTDHMDVKGIQKFTREIREFVLKVTSSGNREVRETNYKNIVVRTEWIELLAEGRVPYEGYESPKEE